MKWLTTLLAVSTLVFAGGTWHFAKLLRLERERNVQQVAAPVPPTAPMPAPPPDPAPESATATQTPPAVQGNKTAKPPDPGQIAVTRHRLDELHDPAARAERGQAFVSLLRADWVQMAPHVGLSPSELDRFMADMSERMLKRMERLLQCELDPACDPKALRKAPGMTQDELIAAALGPDRYKRFRAYQDSFAERNVVFALNLELPAASAVNDAAGDQLVAALGTLRRQFVQNAEGLGEKVQADNGIYSSAVAGAPDEYARRRETATEYVRRELQIAGGILTPKQLAVLKDQQERYLYGFTDRMKNAEVAAAARAAADQP